MTPEEALVVWHDVECGTYRADLPLWRELAADTAGTVLDVGAGTGRVALDLAAAGHQVMALDREPALIAALDARAVAAGLRVATVVADASDFELGASAFGLILVPMQTIQLLSGEGRAGFLACARRHLRPGGRLAMALAEGIQPFDGADGALPDPDVLERDGRRYASQPLAVRPVPGGMRLERRRVVLGAGAGSDAESDAIVLAELDAEGLQRDAAAAGFAPERVRVIPETDRHVGSRVVVLRA